MGELALSLLFKNVGAAIGKGDLALDGKEFEIKGEGATLGARPDTVDVSSVFTLYQLTQKMLPANIPINRARTSRTYEKKTR